MRRNLKRLRRVLRRLVARAIVRAIAEGEAGPPGLTVASSRRVANLVRTRPRQVGRWLGRHLVTLPSSFSLRPLLLFLLCA